ncbi:MAG: beta propeller repeat protein [Acidimicrobiales bacterium]
MKVERTFNAGKSWTSIALPAPLEKLASSTVSNDYPFVQLTIYFASSEDGWIYGAAQPGTSSTGVYVTPDAELWSTRDGGSTWSAIRVKSLGMKFNVLAVSAMKGQVYAIGWRTDQTFGLWQSSVATDSWKRVNTPTLFSAAGGTSMEGALVFKGTGSWLMVGNDRGVTVSARLTRSGQWVKWTGPCSNVGSQFAVPVATSASTLADVCTIGGYAGNVAHGTPRNLKVQSTWIFTSRDGGLTFVPSIRIGADNTSQWLNQLLGFPASPSPGVIFVAKSIEKGQTSIEHLYETESGGHTWFSVYSTTSSVMNGTIQLVGVASPRLISAIVQVTATTSKLIVSTDGGMTWHQTNT